MKICADLDNSSEKKNSDWGLKMEVEERLEKFEATVENTNTKVGMLHMYTFLLNFYETLILLTLLVKMMYFDDVNDVKIPLVTPALLMNFGLSRDI